MTPPSLEFLRQGAADLRASLIATRRDLHRHPELSYQEKRTAALGRDWFRELGLEVHESIAGTHGLTAKLTGGHPGATLLIRADMDALPIEEKTGADYASQTDGVMHACGHDVHTTCLLGAASLLSAHREALHGHVVFLLQPAEEKPPGGAKLMVEQGGVLSGVDAAVALHVDAELPAGQVGFLPGITLAHSARFEIVVRGRGGHAAMPNLALDPVPVASQVVQGLQNLVSRESDPLEPLVITVGTIQGGTAPNVIADEVRLTGTARTFSDVVAAQLAAQMERVVSGICLSAGASHEFLFEPGYPAFSSDPALTERFRKAAALALGPESVVKRARPVMGGEDFAYIAREVPSVFFWLGVRNEARGIIHPVHSPRFDVDEAALPTGAAAMAAIAMDYLSG